MSIITHAGSKIKILPNIPGSINYQAGYRALLITDEHTGEGDYFFSLKSAMHSAERVKALCENRCVEYKCSFIEVLNVTPGSVREANGTTHRVAIDDEWHYCQSLEEAQELVDKHQKKYTA